MKHEIIRKNSLYGNMKWNLMSKDDIGNKSSTWYKTRKEAEYAKNRIEKFVEDRG